MKIVEYITLLSLLTISELYSQAFSQGKQTNYDEQYIPYWWTDQPTWYCPQNYQFKKVWCPPGSNRGWDCWDTPWFPYDEIHVILPAYGKVIGRSLMMTTNRYVNLFLGVPYARPPIGHLRFKVNIILVLTVKSKVNILLK